MNELARIPRGQVGVRERIKLAKHYRDLGIDI